MVCTVWALILGTVPYIVLWFDSEPITVLSFGTVLNEFPDSLFINLFCAHAVFETSTDKE